MIQGDFSLYVLIFPALPALSAQSRLMTISTLKTLNPVKITEGAKTTGPKLTPFRLKPNSALLLNLSRTCCSINARASMMSDICKHFHSCMMTPRTTIFVHSALCHHLFTISSVLMMSGSYQHPSQSTTSTSSC